MSAQSATYPPDVPGRTRFVLLSLLIVLGWNYACSLVGWGWQTAAIITAAVSGSYVAFAWCRRDLFLARILFFSLAVGWMELLADWWLVDAIGTLVYNPNGPFVWRSPLYMPFAWMVVTTQLGYIGWLLGRRFGNITASLLIGVIGAVNIPLYEQWARGAGWWQYRNASMLGNTPLYIIGGEFLIALTLPALLSLVEKSSWRVGMAAGALQGLWIWGAYRIAFWVLP